MKVHYDKWVDFVITSIAMHIPIVCVCTYYVFQKLFFFSHCYVRMI